jgi:hypothetical protein
MTKISNAYIAGIIDGEGCIALQKHKGRSYATGYQICPHVSVSNTNLQLLLDLLDATKVGAVSSYMHKNKPNWKRANVWQIYGTSIAKLLKRVLPYLRVKHAQAILVLEFVGKYSKYGRTLTEFDKADQFRLYEAVSKLNKKGQ